MQLPDRPEPFGLATIEAWRRARPPLSDLRRPYQKWYVTLRRLPRTPRRTAAAAERVVELVSNDRLRKRMGKAASRRVDREFPSPATPSRFEEFIEIQRKN